MWAAQRVATAAAAGVATSRPAALLLGLRATLQAVLDAAFSPTSRLDGVGNAAWCYTNALALSYRE